MMVPLGRGAQNSASFDIDTQLLAISQSMLDESRELLASLSDRQVTSALLMSSRVMIAESRRLLVALERSISPRCSRGLCHEAIAMAPAARAGGVGPNADDNPAILSVRVFKKGTDFGWTIYSPTKEQVGRGTADTEKKARIDAFRAGMTYIDRSKGRSASSDTSLH